MLGARGSIAGGGARKSFDEQRLYEQHVSRLKKATATLDTMPAIRESLASSAWKKMPLTRMSLASGARQSVEEQMLYDQHVRRIKTAKAKIDSNPGKVNVASLLKLGTVLHDMKSFNKIHKYNLKLLRNLNEIKYAVLHERNKFKWEPHGLNAAEISVLSSPTFRYRALQLARKNRKFAARLEAIRHRNQAAQLKVKKKVLKCRINKFKLPEKILAKYENKVEIPQDSCLQFKLFRPTIFMDLEARKERPIGRVTFQLYTEACPLIVLELVKVFMAGQQHKTNVCRIFPKFWAECEVAVDGRTFNGSPGLEYDKRALDHGTHLGIISVDVRKDSLLCLRHGLLVLALSFKPIPILNGRRVAIGRVINGRRNLTGLSEYGTKNGKPLKNIVITKMGMVEN